MGRCDELNPIDLALEAYLASLLLQVEKPLRTLQFEVIYLVHELTHFFPVLAQAASQSPVAAALSPA